MPHSEASYPLLEESSAHPLEVGRAYSILGFNEWIIHGNDFHITMLNPVANELGSVFSYST